MRPSPEQPVPFLLSLPPDKRGLAWVPVGYVLLTLPFRSPDAIAFTLHASKVTRELCHNVCLIDWRTNDAHVYHSTPTRPRTDLDHSGVDIPQSV
jgi:hypothetical protein